MKTMARCRLLDDWKYLRGGQPGGNAGQARAAGNGGAGGAAGRSSHMGCSWWAWLSPPGCGSVEPSWLALLLDISIVVCVVGVV